MGRENVICYENRNGLVLAYDVAANRVVVPGGQDVHADQVGRGFEVTPEDYLAELTRRGVATVLAYAGPSPSWVDGRVTDFRTRVTGFCQRASQSGRGRGVWTPVPVARIADGSDWADVYGGARADV